MIEHARFGWRFVVVGLFVAAGAWITGCQASRTAGGGDATSDIDAGSNGGDTDAGSITGTDAGEAIDAFVAVDAGVDSGAPEPCSTPGATESVACGNCGRVTRFCSAGGTWSYGECTGEGVCAPGSAGPSQACGNCGTVTTRCDSSCHYVPEGACMGEGACRPGTRTRTTTGCAAGETQEATCNDRCTLEPAGMCRADGCDRAGVIEMVPCGNCGMQSRFCTSTHVWEYGVCDGEGECAAGTTGMAPCGRCGSRPARCTDRCVWLPTDGAACTGEGVCSAGEVVRTASGCSDGQSRAVQCTAMCTLGSEVSACTARVPVDVTILLDQTGSALADVTELLGPMRTRLISPLLGLSDVSVGVSYTGEFPFGPYGTAGDRPFQGGREPTTDAMAIESALTSRPTFAGSDASDATVEALSILAGGSVSASSLALTCSTGRTPGGCWHGDAIRVIVIPTDSPIHNGPSPMGDAIYDPYTSTAFTAATWPTVRDALRASHTIVLFVSLNGVGDEALAQWRRMVSDLSQPMTDVFDATSSALMPAAMDAVFARIRALAAPAP